MAAAGPAGRVGEPAAFYSFESFDANGTVVTNAHIDDLRDSEGL